MASPWLPVFEPGKPYELRAPFNIANRHKTLLELWLEHYFEMNVPPNLSVSKVDSRINKLIRMLLVMGEEEMGERK